MPMLPGKIVDSQGDVVAEMNVWVEINREKAVCLFPRAVRN
ncbi:MAG TPA: hypothetical protein VM219_00655 [Phycisphaerae bacterium]|nr:hypothetical protein [Phycisphaerae bacterium]